MNEVHDDPKQMLADTGYDSDAVRDDITEARWRGHDPDPGSATAGRQGHLRRNRIERFFNRIKNSRRVATRYDKLIESFVAFVLLATIRL